ncbi:uncharacterized protein isoform X2 [Leptinotarsa decemlineata]|uniref:uncharacterized protein isoform X2 n=1 Tax=Leptinotarsa decemlineata TaxID=7539 RepID=UPI003D30448A
MHNKDIYVSTDPIICFPCIQHLVNVYNFKTRCINTESIIRSYMQKNNLSEYGQVNLVCVVQDLLKINQYYKEQEEKRKLVMRVENGVNNLSTHSNTKQIVNSVLPHGSAQVSANIMSPLSIPSPINNIPHIDTQHLLNKNPDHISPSSKENSQLSSHTIRPQIPSLPSQNSVSFSIPLGNVGPMPPVTGLLSFQGKPNGPVFLLAPTNASIPQNNILPQRIPSEPPPPPPLIYHANLHKSPTLSQTETDMSVQDQGIRNQEMSSKGLDKELDTITKNKAKPFVHPIESKMRLVIRIPRSKISFPEETSEIEDDDCDNKNNDSYEMENMREDVEMSENDCISPSDLYEEVNPCNEPNFFEASNIYEEEPNSCEGPTSCEEQSTYEEPNLCEESYACDETNMSAEKHISKIYNCTCMYLTTSETLFNEHKKNCKNNSKNLLRCPHCPHVTNRSYALSKHINTMHTKAVWFLCEYCTYRSTDKSCLRRHMRKNHTEHSSVECVCKVCGHVCSNQYNLSKHITKHEMSPPLNCEFCSYSSKDRSNFRKHIFTHSIKELDCEFCSYHNVSPYQMRVHLKKFHDGVGIEDIDCQSDRPVSEIINDIKAAMEEHQVSDDIIE